MVRALTVVTVATCLAIAGLFTTSVPAPALATGSGIMGLVTDESGTPLGGIHVEACPGPDCATTTTRSTVTDGANFRLVPLSPGAYRVSFHDPTLVYAFGYLGSGGYTPDHATAVLLPAGSAADVRADVRLPLANRLTGTIIGRGGVPLAGIDVLALGRDACVLPLGCLRATTGVDGTFTVRGLTRGTYQIRFGYQLGNAQSARWYTTTGDSRDRAAATPITISGTDVHIEVDFPLDADSCGRPIEPFHRWTLVHYPYACRDGSPRRALIGGQELQTVVGGGPGLVALGRREFAAGAASEAAAFTSADGGTWSAVRVDPRVQGDIANGHGWLVAVGPGTGGRSADGVTWRVAQGPPSATATIAAITGDGPGFVAIGQRSAGSSRAAVWTSTDGLRWRQAPDQTALGHFCARSIAGRPSGFVAVGTDCHSPNAASAVIITSRDGRTWRRAPAQRAFSGNAVPMSVIRGGAGFIAGGNYRRVGGRWGTALWTSADGATWRRVGFFSPAGGARWIVRTAGGFVAVGPPSRAFDSRDGISWSSASAYRMPVPDNILGRSWDVGDAAGGGSSVIIVGSYSESDGASSSVGTSPIEYGGLVWMGAPF
jgi:hypothetical protein